MIDDDRSDFRVQIRRLFVIMIRMSYRWICNHPFLLGFVSFCYLLYSTCPLLFALLISASPVLVCTAVLLGTILSFGQTNIPEIEKESEVVHEASFFRTEVSRDAATVVERGEKSFNVESFMNTEKDLVEDGNDDDLSRLGENQLSEVEEYGGSFDYRPLVDETLDESRRDVHVRFEDRAFVLELEKRGDENMIENNGKQGLGVEQVRENGDDFKDDQVDLSPISPWRPMRHEDDDDDDADRDDSLDSESDGAESSSPDASMTDIIPMLDELHPLLHSGGTSRALASGEGSDTVTEGHHRTSSDEGMESDLDSESHGEEGDNENDDEEDEDEEEEEEKKDNKEDESKSAIKWTEIDQRNLMDLGSLELERNQRLENLIARRRARHNMRLMAERNLIDLDSADIPFNMPHISTAKQNPFDIPYDSYDDGLPPIPGSAPSIMFARRNPFDLPYDPNEEKPDLKGDGFQEEITSPQPKDPVFRRHESFSVGPSMLGGPRHDRLRPFFVLERLAHEGTSYYPFERQLSEVSESKVSSVPDTESVGTILDDEDKKDADRGTEMANVDASTDHDEEKNHSSEQHSDFSEEEVVSRNLHHDVAEIILGGAEKHHEQSNMVEGETSDKEKLEEEEDEEAEEEDDDSSDTESSLSEKEEKISDSNETEENLILEQRVDLHEEPGTSFQPSFEELELHLKRTMEVDDRHDKAPAEDSFITAQPSLEESAIRVVLSGLEDDQYHEKPVYDSSPPSASRVPSFSSVSSDYKPDFPGKNGQEIQENGDKEHEVFSESISGLEDIHSISLGHSSDHESEKRTREVGETSLHVATMEESPDITSTSENRSVAEGILHQEDEEQKQNGQASSETFNADIPVDNFSTLSSGAVEYVKSHSFNEEDVPQEMQRSQTMDIEVDSVNDGGQNLGSDETNPSESNRELTWSDKSVVEQSILEPDEDQVPTRPVTVVFSRNITFHEYHDAPEDTAELSCLTSDTSSSPADSPEYETPMVGESSRTEFFHGDVYDDLDHVAERLDQFTEEGDEIKEIDEGLLSEIDTIGDFSVKEVVTDSEPGPSSIVSNTVNETEDLPVLEERSIEDIGSEAEDVILPSNTQEEVSEELDETSTESKSDLAAMEPKSPESEGSSGETSSVEERSGNESHGPLNNTPMKEEEEEEEESRQKEKTLDVPSNETRSLEEQLSELSDPKVKMALEIIAERVIPTESDATLSDELVTTEEAKPETSSNADVSVQSYESKDTPEDSSKSNAKQKTKEQEGERRGD